MKITYIGNTIIPSRLANSIHIMKMCQALTDNSHDVTLIIPDRKLESEQTNLPLFEYYNIKKSFKIVKVPWSQKRGKFFLYAFQAVLKAKKSKPDLIYTRFLFAGFFSILFRQPTILELHQPIEIKSLEDILFKIILKSPHLIKIVVISKTLMEHIKSNYKSSVEIQISPDGADSNTATNTISFENDAILQIGYVGNLYPGKGMELIIKLADMYPQGHFHIIGGSENDIQYWKKQTDKLANISFYGFIPPSQTDIYRISCDVLIAPYQHVVHSIIASNLSEWMSPLKIFEYMAAKRPIIASDLIVLKEVLHHNKNSLLCDPENPTEWRDALHSLENKQTRTRISQQAYDDFCTKYTWKKRAHTILEELK